ncbi:MAG: SCP2 sterol-binding domain-containing protein [Pseudorhodobacter sp.]
MSEIIQTAVTALSQKIDSFDGVAKFVISGEGTVMIDEDGVRAADEEADVTLTAEADVFREILDGNLDPTAAFMSGKLTIDGAMGVAMKLASALA